MRKLLERLLRVLPGILPDIRDLITFGGLGCACYGIAQINPPAAWIVGGACLFWLGVRRN